MTKFLLFPLGLIIILYTTFCGLNISNILIQNNAFGWLLSFISPAVLFFFGLIIFSIGLSKFVSKKSMKILSSVISLALFVTLYLVQNKPYIEDYSKKGDVLSISNNLLLTDIISENSHYDGIVMIASKSCPYCMATAKKLSILKKRCPKRDVSIYIYSTSIEAINGFKLDSEVDDLDYRLVVDEESSMTLCNGKFPTILYVKNNSIIHRWHNRDLGMPALDWIESGLN